MAGIWNIPPSLLISGAVILAIGLAVDVNGRAGNDRIPVVGVGFGPFARQIASLRSFTCLHEWIAEGYRKHASGVFRVRAFREWMVIVSGPELIDQLRRAPEDVLSFQEASEHMFLSSTTLCPNWRDYGPLHMRLIRKLSREIPHHFSAAIDEIDAAFTDEVDSKLDGNEWTTLPVSASEIILRVVCRTTNRLFVGLEKCRDPDYINLNVQYTRDLVVSAFILRSFPSVMRPMVFRFLTPLPRTFAHAERVMTGFLENRLRRSGHSETEDSGNGAETHPDDFLQWIIDAGEAGDDKPQQLITHLLGLNFAGIHATSMTFISALYHIAAEPEKYQTPIRKEAHDVLSRYGWSTSAVENLHRIDSLLRETLRFDGLVAASMTRKAMKDFAFADGTQIRRGDMVSHAIRATHHDGAAVPDAGVFDGFRFCTLGEDHGDGQPLSNRLVSTSFEYLAFGTGKHACPGRFWAANEMKAMMAYMVTHYDMKMEHEGVVPRGTWFGTSLVPDLKARVLIRKREAPLYSTGIP